MATKAWHLILTILLFACSAGCGILYTNTIKPYSTDFDNTPIGSKRCTINAHRFKEPVTRLGISGEWDTNNIKKAAREAGITKIYYADMQTINIVLGTYRRKTLILYGD